MIFYVTMMNIYVPSNFQAISVYFYFMGVGVTVWEQPQDRKDYSVCNLQLEIPLDD